ncbi:MAG: CidA/LrgA family protein [Treponema sp.]|nr:CidA/LrgA family protein [Treponema sp.]
MTVLQQLALIFCICLAGEAISALLPIVFPGSICAMLILLALLCTKIIKTEELAPAGTWFQHNMAFFFLPANISIMEEFGLISKLWMQLIFIGVASAVITFAAAAGAATLAIEIQAAIRRKKMPAERVPEGEAE